MMDFIISSFNLKTISNGLSPAQDRPGKRHMMHRESAAIRWTAALEAQATGFASPPQRLIIWL
jgi:hypothetical protein